MNRQQYIDDYGLQVDPLFDMVDKLENDIVVMVGKAASKHRPAYDEQQAKIAKLEKVVDAGAELEKEVYAYMEFTKLPDNIMSLCCNFCKALTELKGN